MEKELFLKLYKDGHFNFDYFDNCDVCNTELCKFYNDIMLIKKKNFNKIDALFDLVNISIQLNSLNHSSSLNEEYYNDSLKQINRLSKRNIQLKQQLAEKDNEIENLKLCKCASCKNEYDFMLEGMVSDLEKELDKCNQEKISFAIDQLDKFKDCLKTITYLSKNREYWFVYLDDLLEHLDNQIKQLKESN